MGGTTRGRITRLEADPYTTKEHRATVRANNNASLFKPNRQQRMPKRSGQAQNRAHSKPVKVPIRNIPIHFREITREKQWALNRDSILRSSKSDWAAGLVTRAKKDKDVRLCGNFKPLNAVTVKDNYSLFCMREAKNMIEGAVLFSKLDCA